MEVVSGDDPELAPDYARDKPYASYFRASATMPLCACPNGW